MEITYNFIDILNLMASFEPIPAKEIEKMRGQILYAVADYPYGKSIRGYKKWRKREFGL